MAILRSLHIQPDGYDHRAIHQTGPPYVIHQKNQTLDDPPGLGDPLHDRRLQRDNQQLDAEQVRQWEVSDSPVAQ